MNIARIRRGASFVVFLCVFLTTYAVYSKGPNPSEKRDGVWKDENGHLQSDLDSYKPKVSSVVKPLQIFDLKYDLIKLKFPSDQPSEDKNEISQLIELFKKGGYDPEQITHLVTAEECVQGIRVKKVGESGIFRFSVCGTCFLINPLDHTEAVALPGFDPPGWYLLNDLKIKKVDPNKYRVFYDCNQDVSGRGASVQFAFIADFNFKNKSVTEYLFDDEVYFRHLCCKDIDIEKYFNRWKKQQKR